MSVTGTRTNCKHDEWQSAKSAGITQPSLASPLPRDSPIESPMNIVESAQKEVLRMTILDPETTFVKLDKLIERMDRLEKAPDSNEWQYTRLLIRALAEGIAKSKRSSVPVSRKIRINAPAPVQGDWDELLDVLRKKGIQAKGRRTSSKA